MASHPREMVEQAIKALYDNMPEFPEALVEELGGRKLGVNLDNKPEFSGWCGLIDGIAIDSEKIETRYWANCVDLNKITYVAWWAQVTGGGKCAYVKLPSLEYGVKWGRSMMSFREEGIGVGTHTELALNALVRQGWEKLQQITNTELH